MKLNALIAEYILPPAMARWVINLLVSIRAGDYLKELSENTSLHNKYQGQRCFLLGSGNSIKQEDLAPLQNEHLFALNNFHVHPQFRSIFTGEGDKFYFIAPIHPPQTEAEWVDWIQGIEQNVPSHAHFIFGLNRNRYNLKYLINQHGLLKGRGINWYFSGSKHREGDAIDIDLTCSIIGAEAVSVYAIIAALYMGFSEIYLLGMDHDYFLYDNEEEMRMYAKAPHQQDELARTFGDAFYRKELLRQYEIFTKYQDLNQQFPGRIFNAGQGGLLRIFQRVRFQDLF